MATTYFQEIIDKIETLSLEDQDYLFDLIKKRRIEKRRLEIANNAEAIVKDFQSGKLKKGTAEEIKVYLLENEEE
ncbi:MAG: hypothetical protein DSM107014_03935 [Gomphosphaeria aponina SAG 52.96 = DSM 107014]|uniref:HigA protein (Antitoxin to HigB) n=1 Tax=Gomphosphaeria aponina SAG 52.96 = DSM 107014 TaxID=1521640 RepID=A0A941JUL5_9CHRO|nr:hypothetical protein [Gomphosphaeria aponina SAG 52.96 = DSM 107014]